MMNCLEWISLMYAQTLSILGQFPFVCFFTLFAAYGQCRRKFRVSKGCSGCSGPVMQEFHRNHPRRGGKACLKRPRPSPSHKRKSNRRNSLGNVVIISVPSNCIVRSLSVRRHHPPMQSSRQHHRARNRCRSHPSACSKDFENLPCTTLPPERVFPVLSVELYGGGWKFTANQSVFYTTQSPGRSPGKPNFPWFIAQPCRQGTRIGRGLLSECLD